MSERVYWPIRTLKELATYPHRHGTWLGWGHTVQNGDPPEPYARGTSLYAVMLVAPVLPAAFHHLPVGVARRFTSMQSSRFTSTSWSSSSSSAATRFSRR